MNKETTGPSQPEQRRFEDYSAFLNGATSSLALAIARFREVMEADLVCVLEKIEDLALRPVQTHPYDKISVLLTSTDLFEQAQSAQRYRLIQNYGRGNGTNLILSSWGAQTVILAPLYGASFSGVLLVAWKRDIDISGARDSLVGATIDYLNFTMANAAVQREYHTAEVRLSAIVETMPQGVIFTDYETKRAWLNGPASQLLRVPAGDCPSSLVAEAMQAVQREDLLVWDVLPDDELFEVAHSNTKNLPQQLMSRRVLNVRTRRVRAGASAGRMWILEDITDAYWQQQIIKDSLQSSERRWQFALEGAGDGVWDWDVESERITFSKQWKAMLGYGERDVQNHISEFDRRVHPDDHERIDAAVKAMLSGQTHGFSAQFRMQCKDGSFKWILSRGQVIESKRDGTPSRIIGTHADLTAIKESEAERERLHAEFLQSQKMESLGRLAGGIAHDFNNLLTVILGCSDLLLGQLLDNNSARRHAEQVRSAGERARDLTRQLLAFSRKSIIQPKLVDLGEVVSSMENLLDRLVGENIAVRSRVRSAGKYVEIDPSQLEQIILNLLVNARDAMPDGGRIDLETKSVEIMEGSKSNPAELSPGEYVVLSVSDTGTGIEASVVEHIFEPFFTTKEQGKGTGLGLSTVYGIVRQSRGAISVDTAVGSGTTFHIYLPVTTKPVPRLVQTAPSKVVGGPETILFAEDEEAVRMLLASAMEGLGYHVIQVADGESALRQAIQMGSKLDLVISDTVMPRMGGRELCANVRKLFPGTKFLLISGYLEDAGFAQHVDHDFVYFLEKPFSIRELAEKIRAILGETHRNLHG